MGFYDNLTDNATANPWVLKNSFRSEERTEEVKEVINDPIALLPKPFLLNSDDAIDAYNAAWKIAVKNYHFPSKSESLGYPYIDTAFNDCIFLWDSAFISLFGIYGRNAFPSDSSLFNFYQYQHPDGFICREIRRSDAGEAFDKYNPASTEPNILAWAEQKMFMHTGDYERIKKVFPALYAYTDWFRINRTWQNGTLWASGWSSGADNVPRLGEDVNLDFNHGHLSWIDATIQHAISIQILKEFSAIYPDFDESQDIDRELSHLIDILEMMMWDSEDGFFYDLDRAGNANHVQSIVSFWIMQLNGIERAKIEKMVRHLENPLKFGPPHPFPSLARDQKSYSGAGNYWRGSVWAPTNYMVLDGLYRQGYKDLAYQMASIHHQYVLEVFKETGTFWENYSAEKAQPGIPAKADFVGWTGLSAITIFIEYILGIHMDAPANAIHWDLRQLSKHGVHRLPFRDFIVDLICDERSGSDSPPRITIRSPQPINIYISFDSKSFELSQITDFEGTLHDEC
jgi:hypothetical protein